MSNNELRHFKYVDKYKKNGKWIYVYPGEKARKNILGKTVLTQQPKTMEAWKYLNKTATDQVNKYTPSRNVPGANDQTSTSGKKMSELHRSKAKYMAEYHKDLAAYGSAGLQKKSNVEQGTKNWHRSQLKKSEFNNALNLDRTSGNTRERREYEAKWPDGTHYDRKPSNTLTKKTIKKAVRKAKVKTLKRSAAKSINRAKSWLGGLFG